MINKFRQTDGLIQPAGGFTRPRDGFTLVEVMVCSVIFVIFCVFFLNSTIMSMRSQQLACDYYKAMTIARNRIQRATEFEYDSILLMSEDQIPVDGKGNISSAGIYRRTTLVSAYTNGTPNLLQITVQVHYPQRATQYEHQAGGTEHANNLRNVRDEYSAY